MKIVVDDKTFEIEIKEIHGKFKAFVDDEQLDVQPKFDKFGQMVALIIDGKEYDLRLTKDGNQYKVSIFKTPLNASIVSTIPETEETIRPQKEILVTAPMSGLVIKLEVKSGDMVEIDDGLLILEAMKMQNEIKSPIKAKVSAVYVKVGQTVEKDEKLLTLEPI
ncbi:MAG: biotin/lipoyl-binding protein [candidate division WOR-3 bacterium]|nr:biotin/lipoyl-binding protein [candidate division WOR-3 bacterium]